MNHEQSPIVKRPSWRFSLRTLLWIVTLTCLALSFWLLPNPRLVVYTGRELDVAIIGEGFFRCTEINEKESLYTRRGSLVVDAHGSLSVMQNGKLWQLIPSINASMDRRRILIKEDGTVSQISGDQDSLSQIGTIELTRFQESIDHLFSDGKLTSELVSIPVTGPPGINGYGFLQIGWLETSIFSWPVAKYYLPVIFGAGVLMILMRDALPALIARFFQ